MFATGGGNGSRVSVAVETGFEALLGGEHWSLRPIRVLSLGRVQRSAARLPFLSQDEEVVAACFKRNAGQSKNGRRSGRHSEVLAGGRSLSGRDPSDPCAPRQQLSTATTSTRHHSSALHRERPQFSGVPTSPSFRSCNAYRIVHSCRSFPYLLKKKEVFQRRLSTA